MHPHDVLIQTLLDPGPREEPPDLRASNRSPIFPSADWAVPLIPPALRRRQCQVPESPDDAKVNVVGTRCMMGQDTSFIELI